MPAGPSGPAGILRPVIPSCDTVAELLVRTGAVAFRTSPPFRLTSGVDSPVYVDNRRLLGHVAERREVVSGLTAAVEAISAAEPVGAIAGTATAGIAWAAWIADRLGLPMLYVRSQAKQWGQARAVEGTAPDGARIVLVEDLAFSAGSIADATVNLRDAGFDVRDALTIVSYDTTAAHARLAGAGLHHRALTRIDDALAAARRSGALSDDQVGEVTAWLTGMRGSELEA